MNAKKYIFKCMYNLRLWLLAVLFIGMHGFIQGQVTVIYYTPGDYNITLPSNVTSATGHAYGGGGGGGGAYSTFMGINTGRGGGGGAYNFGQFNTTVDKNFSIKVGAGGAGGVATSGSNPVDYDGKPGNVTTINFSGGESLNADGGKGGGGSAGGNTSSPVGSGASGNYNGADGNVNGAGGGGAGAGSSATGRNGGSSNGVLPAGGNGGPAPETIGIDGSPPGGGGGGAYTWGVGSGRRSGGRGGNGCGIIVFTSSPPVITGKTSYCEEDKMTLTVENPNSSVIYTWKLNGSEVNTGTTYTISNIALADAGSYTVECSYTFSGATSVTAVGTGISVSSSTVTFTSTVTNVTVNPKPKITTQRIGICSGETFVVKPTHTGSDVVPAGTTYNWEAPTVEGILGTNGETSLSNISGTLTNTTNVEKNVTYNVTPTSSNGCVGNNFDVVVSVHPIATISDKLDTICTGGTFAVAPTNSTDIVPDGTTYTWSLENSLPTGVTSTPISGINTANISASLTNSNATSQDVIFKVTPETNGCKGSDFHIRVTVNPGFTIPSQTVSICSGESINFIPDQAPEKTNYEWSVSYVYPTESVNASSGSGSTINLGILTNKNNSENATVVYLVKPTTTKGCQGMNFSLTAIVHNIPQITFTETIICSGQSVQLYPDPKSNRGIYNSSDNSIAYVDANGILHTDVDLVDGIPIRRPIYDVNEGKGGTVEITYTTIYGCETKKDITVTPRTKTPRSRWSYDGICPIKEDTETHTAEDSLNISTPWNQSGVYFADHIVWDSLVMVNSLDQIKWYADEACTQFIRNGGEALPPPSPYEGSMASFWQNIPHENEVYWATVKSSEDSCESRPIRVEVYIRENPEQINIVDLIGYVQPNGENISIDLSDFLNLNLDQSESLEWYVNEEDATNPLYDGDENKSEISEPDPLHPIEPVDSTFWIVKADEYGCRSLPTPFRTKLVPMPQITIAPDTLICPGNPVEVTITISDGTVPYSFTVTNMNLGDAEKQTNKQDNTYSFTTNPLSTTTYRITEFSDFITPLITDHRLGLRSSSTDYFDQATLRVVATEILGIQPNSGPTAGGVYTDNPDAPVNNEGKVTISGIGFVPFPDDYPAVLPLVTFGGIPVPASNIEVLGRGTMIRCTPPPNVSGYVTVTVTTLCATVTLTNGYHYDPINITNVTPDYAPVTGGTQITIRGTGFDAMNNANPISVTLAGVTATDIEVISDTEIRCIAGVSNYSLSDMIAISNSMDVREFTNSFTYYPVEFIENGNWSEPHRWKTQTADHILPYPGADIQIRANCLQDISVDVNSITVDSSKAYTLQYGSELKAEVFTLKDNASFIDYNTGSANMQAVEQNVEHVLTKGRNWYISNPVSSPNGLSAINDRIEWYDESTGAWNSTTSLNVGQGYTIYSSSADMDVKFSGKYNDGDKTSQQLTRTNDNGFNLVGNPFPSYWRWTEESALQANLYSTIWYRTQIGGVYTFLSYNASGNVTVAPTWEDDTPTGSYSLSFVPPMQAFWVRVKEGSSSVLPFADANRTHADHSSNVLKSTGKSNTKIRPLLRLTADNGVSIDEAIIYQVPESKEEFDTYDSDKFFINQGVEIYTQPAFSTRKLVINGIPEIADGTEVPLGFQASEGGAFTFRAKEILKLDELDVFLLDKWRNTEFNLRTGDYNFTSNSIPVTDRFSIIFRNPTKSGLDNVDTVDDNLLVYVNGEGKMVVMLDILNKKGSNATISVFDIMGRKLAEQSIVVGERTILKNTFPRGVYVLRAGKCTAKVVNK